ncbi:Ldh family oxidoreductase [Amycolatopsis nigrescens]|uniref:Ldh family oxidoreductase n=1 Tax=Amycolatopsis nigrescens TaxID=381445 RepID=UPI000372C806|nr:Ldh family oxidoreductase [Amycolatopsis nigrescens]
MPQQVAIPEQPRLCVPFDELVEFVADVFFARGLAPSRARLAAEALCYGEATVGKDYGLAGLKRTYLPLLDCGLARAQAEPLVIADRGAAVLVDYRRALGLWAVSDAMDRAVSRAGRHGVAVVSLRGVTDFGRAGHHAARAVPSGMIGLVLAAGGEQNPARHGVNPLGFAAPAGPYPSFVFDLDATALSTGAAGFVLLVEVLAGLLPGVADHDHDTGLMVMAIAPATLRSADGFYRHASALFGSLLGWESGAPDRYPGWREAQRMEQCEAMGVPLAAKLYRELAEIGKQLGLRMPAAVGER